MDTLKIITYNIHYGIGRDGKYNLDRIIKIIATQDPDVVALQEVHNNISRTRFHDQSKLTAEALSMNYYYCVSRFIQEVNLVSQR